MTSVELPGSLRDRRTAAALLFLTALLVYLPAMLGGAFHFDDFHSIRDNPGVRSVANIPRYFVDPQLWSNEPGNVMYRPVLLVTCAIDFLCWGDRVVAGWLLTNAAIHGCCALLVHRLALRLRLGDTAAFLAGAVFVLHPAISEVQNYVSSRSESVAAAAMLAALLVHFSARDALGRRAVALHAAAALLYLVSLLAKETTAAFAGVTFLADLIVPRERRDGRVRAAVTAAAIHAAMLGVFLALRRHFLGVAVASLTLHRQDPAADVQVGGGRSIVEQVLTQCNAQVLYLWKLLFPVALNIDHDLPVATKLADALAGIAVLAVLAAIVVRAALRGARLLPLAAGWYALFSAVTFVIPLNVVMNEHRLYLPMIAVALVAGAALARVATRVASPGRSGARGLAVAAIPLVAFGTLVVHRSREWRDDETLWGVAIARAPRSARAHMHYGGVFHERSNLEFDATKCRALVDRALAEYRIADELHPRWADAQVNLGNLYLLRGRITKDPADFRAALAAFEAFGQIVGTEAPRPRLFQALVLVELGEIDRAITMVRTLAAEDPDSETPVYDEALARCLRRKGDRRGAREAMARVAALQEKDGRVDGLLALGWWEFEDGDLDAAERTLSRANQIAKVVRDFRAPLYIARFLVLMGQADGAERFLVEAKGLGWMAPEYDVRWVAGGATPGTFKGTVQAPR